MIPALFLIPLVAIFRIVIAWQPVLPGTAHWFLGFSPLAAVALCAGIFLPRRVALIIPLGILLLSDAIIDAHYHARFFSLLTLDNYGVLALIGGFGMVCRHLGLARGSWLPVLAATVGGSVFFYVVTNALCWWGSTAYAQSAAGLWQALTLGLPGFPPSYVFFRNELVSDALYSMVFVACVRLSALGRAELVSARPAVG
jgi:hypothetical protein